MERITTDLEPDRWFTAPEAVTYGLADEVVGGVVGGAAGGVIGGPAGAPESGTPA